jgi:site-specific recombinase XerD
MVAGAAIVGMSSGTAPRATNSLNSNETFRETASGIPVTWEVHALLDAPDADTWFGQRDRLLLALLYNTGARVSELTGMRVADVTLAATPWVRLHGKGRKQRAVPLWRETAAAIATGYVSRVCNRNNR